MLQRVYYSRPDAGVQWQHPLQIPGGHAVQQSSALDAPQQRVGREQHDNGVVESCVWADGITSGVNRHAASGGGASAVSSGGGGGTEAEREVVSCLVSEGKVCHVRVSARVEKGREEAARCLVSEGKILK